MAQPDFQKLQDLFNEARQLSAHERASFLDQACQSDAELRLEVEALLEHDNSELIDDSPLGLTRPIAEMVQGRTMAKRGPSREEPLEHSRIGPYLLLKKIGEGGMGTVWMAEQKEPVRRRVALKLIRAGKSDERILKRFEAERQALAMMNHANIARILDAGTTDDGSPYFVMELVNGIPISDYCDRNQLSARQRLELFIPVCNAVQHAHQKGIIHRDLKPSNVLVGSQDGNPIVKVIDFGLAKALQSQIKLTEETMYTEFGQVMGTLQYMSPEQAGVNDEDVDTRADIYSLGSILYKLLTGFTPIDDDSVRQKALDDVFKMIREQDPPRPSKRLSDFGRESGIASSNPQSWKSALRNELDWIVMCAINKDRDQRYATVAALAEDINNYLTGDSVVARPPSRVYRLRKLLRKHWGGFAFAATMMILLTGSTILVLFSNARITTALSAERQAKEEANQAMNQVIISSARKHFLLAKHSWEDDKILEAKRYLSLVPNNNDCRDLEWYLSGREFEGSVSTFYGHEGQIESVAYSPNGKCLASAAGHSIMIRDAQSGMLLQSLSEGSGGVYRSVQFSPDGKCLASGSSDHSVKVWDVNNGVVLATFLGHTDIINCVAFSPDGKHLASASEDKTTRIWNVVSGDPIRTLVGHKVGVKTLDFSPLGNQIATGGNRTVKLWNWENGKLQRTLSSHSLGHVSSVRFSHDGLRVIGVGSSAVVWQVNDGSQLNILSGAREFVAVDPSGRFLASEGPDSTVRLWDLNSASELRVLKGHSKKIRSIVFNFDGTRLATGSGDKTVRQWDVRHGNHFITLEQDTAPKNTAVFSRDGTKLATASSGGNRDGAKDIVRIWDFANGSLSSILKDIYGVTEIALNSDGSQLATVSETGSAYAISLWNAQDGTFIKTIAPNASSGTKVVFSPDSSKLAAFGSGGAISIWKVDSGDELRLKKERERVVSKADGSKWVGPNHLSRGAFCPNSNRLVTCGTRSPFTISIWDAENGEIIKEISFDQYTFFGAKQILCTSFIANGNRLAVCFSNGSVSILNTENWEEVTRLPAQRERPEAAVFSSNGNRLLTGGLDGRIKVWDTLTGDELRSFPAHNGKVTSLSLSPNDDCLASASSDGTTKIWLFQRRVKTRVLKGPDQRRITFLAFNWNDKLIFTEDDSGINYTFDFETGKIVDPANEDHYNTSNLIARPTDLDRRFSRDRRWKLVAHDNYILIVDREFQNAAEEIAYRKLKLSLLQLWHVHQAKSTVGHDKFFLPTFHWACALRYDPECIDHYKNFHGSYRRWQEANKDCPRPSSEVIESASKIQPTIAESFQFPAGFMRLYQNDAKLWIETTNRGKPLYYLAETYRNQEYIQVHDEIRKIDLRFPVKGGLSKVSKDGGITWSKWQVVNRELSPLVLDTDLN